ncbi:hypothetical protein BC938DRAFT_477086 [Jimgerdemannia flammicorona]|uniref:Uncharacterized protein n=1 Tax=Jimgerdemannia flammicorona TaxID=994334 RepID=A0A433QYY7_9FUNG|nr:hypothetical protein BC938DRAFT_477086 [Jimgerdemannia flammicorona]
MLVTSTLAAAAAVLATLVQAIPIDTDQRIYLQDVATETEHEKYGAIWIHGDVRITPPPPPSGTTTTYNSVTVWIKLSDDSVRPSLSLNRESDNVYNWSDSSGGMGRPVATEFWAQYGEQSD